MNFRNDKPYNDLPLLPPDASKCETLKIYKELAEARAVLAELKGRVSVIPDPLMLINTLLLQEAKDSLIIENIITSNDTLFRAFSSSTMKIDGPTKEALRYREAVLHAYNQMKTNKTFNDQLIVNIFKKVTNLDESYREAQVYIGNQFRVAYTPPEAGKPLKQKMKNWMDFSNSLNTLDPLIKMAVLHYQFESIHPFPDGNGRTGRILNVLFLSKTGLLDLPILYLSKFILEFKSEYYRLFTEVTESGNWEDWILYMLKAVKETAKFTLNKVNAIYELYIKTIELVRTEGEGIYSHELIELIFKQPYCKISFVQNANIVSSRNTAGKYLNKLVDMGVLKIEKEGKENLYQNVELYNILAVG